MVLHTNTSTKPMVLNFMKSAMRDFLYIERSLETTFEYEQFEIKEDGKKTGAVEGCHDDRVMSTSIGLYVCYKKGKPYRLAQKNTGLRRGKPVSYQKHQFRQLVQFRPVEKHLHRSSSFL